MPTDVQDVINALQVKGWTLVALADELQTTWQTVRRWREGTHPPANAGPVLAALRGLEKRVRVPKKRRVRKR